ncbi:Aste57867_4766 [Aphanomyces stellatus]|uniref:Aste57867_4766 protein n=1 Tax=Aphanomyces stellatus TaxID=120398 RepID=A0A485KDL3_9STRA|nr:hypothetical protein As57867_004753 [Aphanomyces stellatus]VFT81862.1 Aste57867_4766 [Aphanomyces stellatus]
MCHPVIANNSPTRKCKPQCSTTDCTNLVYARGHCARHGGKRPCAMPDCGQNATSGQSFCLTHGGHQAKKKFCIEVGCTKQVQANQRCLKHGGGRRCKEPGCFQHVRTAGLCRGHLTKSLSTMLDDGDGTLCSYAYKPCTNERALKKDGSLHTLCDFHRRRTNLVQKQYNTKMRAKLRDMPCVSSPKVLSIDPIPYLAVEGTAQVSAPMDDDVDLMDLSTIVFGDPHDLSAHCHDLTPLLLH